MKEVTLKSAQDEGVGALAIGFGVIAGSFLMKMASGKINKWLVPGIGLVGGYGVRLYFDKKEEDKTARDFGSGLLAAGAIDLTSKSMNAIADAVPQLTFLKDWSGHAPQLSGPEQQMQWARAADLLRGPGRETYQNANVVGSQLLR